MSLELEALLTLIEKVHELGKLEEKAALIQEMHDASASYEKDVDGYSTIERFAEGLEEPLSEKIVALTDAKEKLIAYVKALYAAASAPAVQSKSGPSELDAIALRIFEKWCLDECSGSSFRGAAELSYRAARDFVVVMREEKGKSGD